MQPNQSVNNVNRPVGATGAATGAANKATASGVAGSVGGPSAPAAPKRPGDDIVFRDKPKKNMAIILGMVFLTILAAGGIGFGVWAMVDGNQQKETFDRQIEVLKKQNNELQEQLSSVIPEEDDSSDVSTKTCEGVYYGEASGTSSNGLSYDYKYTYTLKTDGTFTADFGGTSGTDGKYMINDNTISFIGRVEIGDPNNEAISYSTKDYIIADDCSLIKINNGEVKFELKRQ